MKYKKTFYTSHNFFSPGPAAFFAAGPDNYIAYSFLTNKSFRISKNNAYKYSNLSGIETEDQFLNDLLNTNDQEYSAEEYKELLSLFEKEKLLYPLQNNDNEIKNKNNLSCAVISCERPELLNSALESIASAAANSENNLPIMLFDDSISEKTVKNNINALSDIKEKHSAETFYFGSYEKKELIKKLFKNCTEKIQDKNIFDFAHFGSKKYKHIAGPGGNRNAVLLRNAGKKIICFDDDTKHEFVSSINSSNCLEISSLKDPDRYLFPDKKRAEKQIINSNLNSLNYIKEILGQSVNTIINNADEKEMDLFTEDLNPDSCTSLAKGKSRIKAAMFGIYGGKWYENPFGVYYLNIPERKNPVKKKEEFDSLKKSPYSLLLPDHLILSKAPYFVASCMAIDAQDIVPPFPPCGRNEDGIWASVMLSLDKNSFIAQLPFAIYHETSNKKDFTDKDFEDTTAGFGIMTLLIIDHIKKKLFSLYRKATYKTFGEYLILLSDFSDENFLSLCHDLWLEYTANSIERLEKLLVENRRKPKHWAFDTEKYIDLFQAQSSIPENAIPKELRNNYSILEALNKYKSFFRDYGELLINWPVIWDAALKLNREEDS